MGKAKRNKEAKAKELADSMAAMTLMWLETTDGMDVDAGLTCAINAFAAYVMTVTRGTDVDLEDIEVGVVVALTRWQEDMRRRGV